MDRQDNSYYRNRTKQYSNTNGRDDALMNSRDGRYNRHDRYDRDVREGRRENESMYSRNVYNSYGRRYDRSKMYSKGVRVVRKGIPSREELDEQLIKYMRGE